METDNLVVVKSNDEEVFTINARGQVIFAGNIIVKDNSFAGSTTTDEDGLASITFTYDLGTGKPDVQLTVEGDTPAFAQISDWVKDVNENYLGFTIKTFNISGADISAIVHYSVVGKQDGYETTPLEIIAPPTPPPSPTPDPTPDPDPTPTPVLGCMDILATNYNPDATEDDGSCIAPDPEPTPEPTPDPEPTPEPTPEPSP
jgi:hypothetical protein